MPSSIKHNRHHNHFNSLKVQLVSPPTIIPLSPLQQAHCFSTCHPRQRLHCCFLCLRQPTPNICMASSFTVFRPLLTCHHVFWLLTTLCGINLTQPLSTTPSNLPGQPYVFICPSWMPQFMPADLTSHLVFNSFYSKKCPNLKNKLLITLSLSWFTFFIALINYVPYCTFACLFSSSPKGTVNSMWQSLYFYYWLFYHQHVEYHPT